MVSRIGVGMRSVQLLRQLRLQLFSRESSEGNAPYVSGDEDACDECDDTLAAPLHTHHFISFVFCSPP